jgi:hypothetical protein
VVIFAGWGNSSKTKFHLYEEYSRGKPARYLTNADLGYYLNRGYGAYRYDRIADVQISNAGSQATVFEMAAVSQPIGLEAQRWSPDLAAQAEPESAAPAAPQGLITPEPVPVVGLPTLIDTQLATDRRAVMGSAGSGSGVVLLAAGLGLLFFTFPLTIAARAGAWTPRRAELKS